MAKTPLAIRVTRTIAATPQLLYELVSEVTRMSEWSPETTSVEWLSPSDRPAVGVRFRGANAIGSMAWKTKPTITEASPGRCFAFRVPRPSNSTWRFEFQPVEGGTEVTQLLDCPGTPALLRFMQRRAGVLDRAADLERDMAVTLERLAATVETSTVETSTVETSTVETSTLETSTLETSSGDRAPQRSTR